MGKRICPICDSQVNTMNFCRDCKRFVKPVEINRDVYVNERHVRSFDNDGGGTGEFRAGSYDTGTNMQNAEMHKKTSTGNSSRRNSRKAIFCIIIGVMVCVSLNVIIGLHDWNNIFSEDTDTEIYEEDILENEDTLEDTDVSEDENLLDEAALSDNGQQEPDYSDYRYFMTPGESGYSEAYGNYVAVSAEEALQDGKECTLYDHYDGISAEKFMANLEEYFAKYDISMKKSPASTSLNLLKMESGLTCYETYEYFVSSLHDSGIDISYDFNTGSIHMIYGWCNIMGEGQYFNLEEIYDVVAKALGEAVLSENIRTSVTDSIEQFKEAQYVPNGTNFANHYISGWEIYVGRGDGFVYFQLYVYNH